MIPASRTVSSNVVQRLEFAPANPPPVAIFGSLLDLVGQ
jgi:hypothetical protein